MGVSLNHQSWLMKINSLTLNNFRGFVDTEITFSRHLTVLVGVNGAGKSSVLDALAMLMSWAGSQIRDDSGRWKLADTDIHAGADAASVGFQFQFEGTDFTWKIIKHARRLSLHKSVPEGDLKSFVVRVLEKLSSADHNCSIPVMVYYPANRAVVQVPIPTPKDARCLDPLETYRSNFPAEAENFHSFFKWFRAREDLENEVRLRPEGAAGERDRDMEAVRRALCSFMPDFRNLTVKRMEDALVFEKHGQAIRVDRLSDGEKLLIAIVGDLARRFSLANPTLEDPLQGEGVVLIDEIEQHLHPAWQRTVIGKLRRVFPSCQFIISTHSPQVLGEVLPEDIRCLVTGKDGQVAVTSPRQSLGLDANQVLEEVLGAPSRNEEISKQIGRIFSDIDKEDEKSLARARREIEKLKKKLDGPIPDLVEAEAMLFMLDGT